MMAAMTRQFLIAELLAFSFVGIAVWTMTAHWELFQVLFGEGVCAAALISRMWYYTRYHNDPVERRGVRTFFVVGYVAALTIIFAAVWYGRHR
jgi:hypothetical protein